jgi:hypothetical protein
MYKVITRVCAFLLLLMSSAMISHPAHAGASSIGVAVASGGIIPGAGTYNVTIQGAIAGVPFSTMQASLTIVRPAYHNHQLDVCLVTGSYFSIQTDDALNGAIALGSNAQCFTSLSLDTADVAIDPSTNQITVSPQASSGLGDNGGSIFLQGGAVPTPQFIYGGSMTLLFDGAGNVSGSIDVLGSTSGLSNGFTYQATLSGAGGNGNPPPTPVAAGALSANPTSIDFGDVTTGKRSDLRTVTLTNNSTSVVALEHASVNSQNEFGFPLQNPGTCVAADGGLAPLASGASCTLNVVFKPATDGPKSATLTLQDSADSNPLVVTLTGNGVSSQPIQPTATAQQAMPTPTSTTAPPASPVPTNTSAPPPPPAPTSTSVPAPTSTTAPPPLAPQATQGAAVPTMVTHQAPPPSSTPYQAPPATPTRPAHPSIAGASSPHQRSINAVKAPPLALRLIQASVRSGEVLTLRVSTAPRAQVSVTLRVTTTKLTFTGTGNHRERVTRITVLYQAGGWGNADKRGLFSGRVRVAYKPAKPVQATLTVTVRAGLAVTTRATKVMIQPAPRRH